jgi:VIT1/CCC1 family predicted Fe2+/Mn2+ transporter
MPSTPHIESHFTASASVRDVVIGMADGLTVPFALAAGITGAIADIPAATSLVVTAGFAEIAAGSIAMGLGGYLAAKTDVEHYESERQREIRETVELASVETEEVTKVFREYGLSDAEMAPVVGAICGDQKRWVDFMMRFELGLEPPDPKRATRSALTIAGAYIFGGMIPLAPYMILPSIADGLRFSIVITLFALGAFGFVKSRFIGIPAWKGALQTVLTGGIAATAAFLLARLIG